MEGLLKLIADNAGGPESGELASIWRTHYQGEVWELPQCVSTMPVPRTFCLYQNWADSTSLAAEPGTAALCLPPGVAGCEGC